MKALIAMSGGVDSSVAALLTKQAGFECIGCTMKLYDGDGTEGGESMCCSLSDVEDARSVAGKLGMPYYVFGFQEEFEEKVIKNFVDSYVHGITPNPCIECNRYLKFGKLRTRARELGCDFVVTGHYARIEKIEDGSFVLKKALDPAKDQSYVLYSMTQKELAHTMFPLGSMSKSEARALAGKNNFFNADKPDSQDICFVPDGDYAKVVEAYTGVKSKPGNFVDCQGNVIGPHKGIIHYTVGQRRGLGIASTEPYYVCRICPENNTVILGRYQDLFSTGTDVREVNWISGKVPEGPVKCKVKIRYRHKEQDAVVTPTGPDSVHIEFEEAQRAITPGQAAVFYDGDIVLGGGVI